MEDGRWKKVKGGNKKDERGITEQAVKEWMGEKRKKNGKERKGRRMRCNSKKIRQEERKIT